LNKGIGMAYVSTPYSNLDSEIYIAVREKSLRAKVVKFPFQ
jgi:aminomethyltransferase